MRCSGLEKVSEARARIANRNHRWEGSGRVTVMEALLGDAALSWRMMPCDEGSLLDGATAADLASPVKVN